MYPDINEIVSSLRKGDVIIYPTDTIWGIGCDAMNVAAIKRIFEIKERKINKALIVLVSDLEMLHKFVSEIHPRIESLLFFHEKPLTVIYNKVEELPEILRGENGSIAIRIVKDEYCREFIRLFGRPIVSTSVNKSGIEAPVNFAEISYDILEEVDYISKHKRNEIFEAQPSSIISFSANGKITFLR